MKIFVLFLSLYIMCDKIQASSGHEGDSFNGIPVVVFYQALNVSIILGAGVYFGHRKIIKFFAEKRKLFLDAQNRAQNILRLAEHEHHEVKTRLDKLKVTRDESISKARADASDLRNQILQDARAFAVKLRNEAKLSAKIELERAKFHLKEQLVKEAFELSKRDLSLKASSEDQKKLQEDFISKVQVAQ